MKLSIKPEKLSRAFKKHHVEGLPFPASFNEFTAPDTGDPHDHPFDFITHILSGGYTERSYTFDGQGNVTVTDIERLPGTSHYVKATDIHQITHLHTGHCVTLMMPQSGHIRATCFYRFVDGKAFRRLWNKRKFLPVV
jgi:predicted metal-dependent enzyme (double-stranded beta helix superfamily)